MDKKSVELLDRLKIVKVSSKEGVQDEEKGTRPLPQMRLPQNLPDYGYEEPKLVPEGRCTLRQALEFITNHQNDPSTHSISSIAEVLKMKPSDVENVINHFKAFQLHIDRNDTLRLSQASVKAFGANKITHQLYDSKFDALKEELTTPLTEEKK